jgi:hypothetical protein
MSGLLRVSPKQALESRRIAAGVALRKYLSAARQLSNIVSAACRARDLSRGDQLLSATY